MTVPEALQTVRYVVNAKGERTDAIIPLAAWRALIEAWKRSLESAEDQEDQAIVQAWLKKRAAGNADMILLEELESELAADGLL